MEESWLERLVAGGYSDYYDLLEIFLDDLRYVISGILSKIFTRQKNKHFEECILTSMRPH